MLRNSLSFGIASILAASTCLLGCPQEGGVGASAGPLGVDCDVPTPNRSFPLLDGKCSMPALWGTAVFNGVDCQIDNCFAITQDCLDEMEATVASVVEGTPDYGSEDNKRAFLVAMQQLLYGPMAREPAILPGLSTILPPSLDHVDTTDLCYNATEGSPSFHLALLEDIHDYTAMPYPVIWGSEDMRNERHYQFVFERLSHLKIDSTNKTEYVAANRGNRKLILAPEFGSDLGTFGQAGILLHELIHGLGDGFFAPHHLGSPHIAADCPIPNSDPDYECDQDEASAYGMEVLVIHALALGYQHTAGHIVHGLPRMRAECDSNLEDEFARACWLARERVVDALTPVAFDCNSEAAAYRSLHAPSGVNDPACLAPAATFRNLDCGSVPLDKTGIDFSASTNRVTVPPSTHDELLEDPEWLIDDEYAAGVRIDVTQNPASGADVFTFAAVPSGSLAHTLGILPGDVLTQVNGSNATAVGLASIVLRPHLVENLTLARTTPGSGTQSRTISIREEEGGCADSVQVMNEQTFAPGMVGCAGTVGWADRANLCKPGWHVCSSAEYVERNFSFATTTDAPAFHYWTDDNLKYSGTSSACSVSTTSGTSCSSPMRVCAPTSTGYDPLNNQCNWQGCGYEGATANRYFGGCAGNLTAGTMCCK
ncbi:PDZ domain-containing protein [Polyangium jinanense]|uniref:PDZ domain-containing protein n=1 Tax=Polyangium jinanense TaxID=2829994 RepID=A0A9X4AZ89_9BACT|nr:PDZ domain-containing protein [Polyangium jinanense]MDC3961572.1 hypothetical protein [Polyangium jinanense]MDC3987937.1 hypothetical protein [Polyangium jinanense]